MQHQKHQTQITAMSEKKTIDVSAMIAEIREQAVIKAMTAAIAKMNMGDLRKLFNNRFYANEVKTELDNIEFEIKDLQHKMQKVLVDYVSKRAQLSYTTDEQRAEFIASITPKPKAKRGRKAAETKAE
jgi:chromosome condensin MukBEF ATPase and DNA-binding subunit MukB